MGEPACRSHRAQGSREPAFCWHRRCPAPRVPPTAADSPNCSPVRSALMQRGNSLYSPSRQRCRGSTRGSQAGSWEHPHLCGAPGDSEMTAPTTQGPTLSSPLWVRCLLGHQLFPGLPWPTASLLHIQGQPIGSWLGAAWECLCWRYQHRRQSRDSLRAG